MPPTAPPNGVYRGDFLGDGAFAPGVNLESLVAHFKALLGEIGERLRAVETAAGTVGMVGAGVCRQVFAVAAQQLVDGRLVELARQVPQGDVDGTDAHTVVLAQDDLRLVVETLPFEGVLADQERREQIDLLEGGRRDADVFAAHALVGMDADAQGRAGALLAGFVKRSHGEAKVVPDVLERKAVAGELDAFNDRRVVHDVLSWRCSPR